MRLDAYRRYECEDENAYIYRVCSAKDLIGSWNDVADIINAELHYIYDESAYRKKYQSFKQIFEANQNLFNDVDEQISKLSETTQELKRERAKLATEKIESNKWLREAARDELIVEKIVSAVRELEPLDIPELCVPDIQNKKAGMLVFGDEHYGTSFKISGLHGEVINAYSPKIFVGRMENLLINTMQIAKKEKLSEIHVFNMGDYTDGILRVSQLKNLREGLIQSTISYSEYMSNWLNRLSEHVIVKFQMVHGNHSELRLLGQPKGTFEEENMGMVVYEFIKARLACNKNFFIGKNPTGLIFQRVLDYNVLGIHGEVKDLEQAVKDFSHVYGEQINILLAGHLHHSRSETVGLDCETVNVPSIMGADPYAIKLRKVSRPGATFLIVENGNGKTIEYNIKL